MGSFIEINDTLLLSREQGFPKELDLEKHKAKPFSEKDFEGRIFEFKNKPRTRVYLLPPVPVYLCEDVEGKWIYWGLALMLEQTINGENETTSGKYQITKIYTLEEMKQAEQIIKRREGTEYFNQTKL